MAGDIPPHLGGSVKGHSLASLERKSVETLEYQCSSAFICGSDFLLLLAG
jgi:hypothetical protein